METNVVGQNRKFATILVPVVLALGCFQFSHVPWEGGREIFSLMSLASTGLAFFLGLIALTTFFSKQENDYFLLSIGLFGTGFLEACQLVITSGFFESYFAGILAPASAWSSSISQIFFSVIMLLTLWFWKRSQDPQNKAISKTKIFLGMSFLTAGHAAFFFVGPWPQDYQMEFVAGILFLSAAVGYYRKGLWATETLEHWILLSLIINAFSQLAYLPFSMKSNDLTAFAAHFLKQAGYFCLLIGLVKNMYQILEEAHKTKQDLIVTHLALEKAKINIEEEAKQLVDSLARLEGNNSRLEDLKRAMLNVVEDLKAEPLKKEEAPLPIPNNVSPLAITKR